MIAKKKAGRGSGAGGGKKPAIVFDLEKVESLAGRGLNKRQIALCLGVSHTTLFENQKKDAEFAAAIDRGKAKANAACASKLISHIEKGNVTALIFYLKCQAGWKETSIIETRDAPPLPDDQCSLEEAEAAYLATMRDNA